MVCRDVHGFTLCHWAAWKGHIEMFDLLKKNNFDMNAINNGGDTMIHITVAQGHMKATKILLESGADVNATNEHGNTPLHSACFWRNEPMIKLLVANGAKPAQTNKFGKTPLHLAGPMANLVKDTADEHDVDTTPVYFKEAENVFGRAVMDMVMKTAKVALDAKILNISDSDELIRSNTRGDTYKTSYKKNDVLITKLRGSNNLRDVHIEDFMAEAEKLRLTGFSHVNVLPMLSVVDKTAKDDCLWIMTQHFPLGTLHDTIQKTEKGQMPVWHIAKGIAKAMAYLHDDVRITKRSCYHLSSHTVKMDLRNTPVLNLADCEFLFQRKFTKRLTHPEYVAPEVFEDLEHKSERSDVYSFGVVLNEMATGEAPHTGLTSMQIGFQVMTQGIRPEMVETTDTLLHETILSCWQAVTKERPDFVSLVRTVSEASS
ncbi:TKL protein kinase [Sphaeroforma arctica JP610]|uniref:TKL protein kinase n=1 Tax=Sphaeroforma arctica JP610 TaxID=667725 RepID=A0A0L0GD40_9EUKA|nr:TKL protein kinase [Sphaeroforma arctica JP610]KNC86824.1 TKL protein kinase [Sphaeroforma arctica JP610]|eukprot:XP_014160726.1 TKL protein kinase [Sphaeroforma arctica JP610]